ncbi:hypothetical protein HZB88_01310, partial [archaeon]|nr:hypothetical protein [archaeon]
GHKIGKVIPLKEKAKALVTSGKHTSKEGSVDAINEKKRLGILNIGKEKLNVKLESLMAIE